MPLPDKGSKQKGFLSSHILKQDWKKWDERQAQLLWQEMYQSTAQTSITQEFRAGLASTLKRKDTKVPSVLPESQGERTDGIPRGDFYTSLEVWKPTDIWIKICVEILPIFCLHCWCLWLTYHPNDLYFKMLLGWVGCNSVSLRFFDFFYKDKSYTSKWEWKASSTLR